MIDISKIEIKKEKISKKEIKKFYKEIQKTLELKKVSEKTLNARITI